MLQTRTCGGEEGLNKLWFAEFGEESEGIASNVFVGMLKIVANAVTAKGKIVRQEISYSNGQGDPYQTRIISCLSLPVESCLGQIS